jgi:hypothetical protein
MHSYIRVEGGPANGPFPAGVLTSTLRELSLSTGWGLPTDATVPSFVRACGRLTALEILADGEVHSFPRIRAPPDFALGKESLRR